MADSIEEVTQVRLNGLGEISKKTLEAIAQNESDGSNWRTRMNIDEVSAALLDRAEKLLEPTNAMNQIDKNQSISLELKKTQFERFTEIARAPQIVSGAHSSRQT